MDQVMSDLDQVSRRGSADRVHQLRVFGPTRLADAGSTSHQRRILAALAHAHDRTCSAEQLIDVVWGERVPASARTSLQNQVARLRRLSTTSIVVTTESGYRLGHEVRIDVADFVEVARAHLDAQPSPELIEPLGRALALWQGQPFADLDDHVEVIITRTQLDELRASVIELLAKSMLTAGEPQGALVELLALVELEPYRDGAWELLMVTMSSLGRRSDAVAAYQRFERQLERDLGVGPSATMTALCDTIAQGRPITAPWVPSSLHLVASRSARAS